MGGPVPRIMIVARETPKTNVTGSVFDDARTLELGNAGLPGGEARAWAESLSLSAVSAGPALTPVAPSDEVALGCTERIARLREHYPLAPVDEPYFSNASLGARTRKNTSSRDAINHS
jgi:hypothetical protein